MPEAKPNADDAESLRAVLSVAPNFRHKKTIDPNAIPFPSLASASAGWPVFSRLFSLILSADSPETLIHRAAVGLGLLPEVQWCEISAQPNTEDDVVQCAFETENESELMSPQVASSGEAWLVVKLHPGPNSAIYAVVGDLLRLIIEFYDQSRHMRRLSAEALCDPLTQLWNRRGFSVHLEQALSRFRRSGERLAIVSFDVDHFKSINDEGGHASGDQSLSVIANAIREVCRPSDIPARLGGDEFTILLCGCDAKGAILVAQRLQYAIDRANPLAERRITLSVGIADSRLLVEQATARASIQPLLDAADKALYAAKESGRAAIRVHPSCQDEDDYDGHYDQSPRKRLGS